MARARKRVHAIPTPIPRGPDGSAFKKCGNCGVSVAIALADMHECGIIIIKKKNVSKKKLKCQIESGKDVKEEDEGRIVHDQPRSAFRFFMEEFMKTCKNGSEVEIDKRGVEAWKSMSKQERLPFVLQADELNSGYVKLLHKEENEMQSFDDEAESAEVGEYDKNLEDYDIYYDSESPDDIGLFRSETIWSCSSE